MNTKRHYCNKCGLKNKKMQMWGIEMTEKPKDVEKYFENSKCKICGVVVQPHFQGNTKLPKEEHLAKEHSDLEWTIRKKSQNIYDLW